VFELKSGIQNSSTGDLALFPVVAIRKPRVCWVKSMAESHRCIAGEGVKKAAKAVIGLISITYSSLGLVPGLFSLLER